MGGRAGGGVRVFCFLGEGSHALTIKTRGSHAQAAACLTPGFGFGFGCSLGLKLACSLTLGSPFILFLCLESVPLSFCVAVAIL